MKASGNGTPQQCTENLLSIHRGENPMERVKGLDTRCIDKLEKNAEADIKEDVCWLLETYEPRVDLDTVSIQVEEQKNGEYQVFAVLADT